MQERKYIPKYIKGHIYEECGRVCAHCGKPIEFTEATLDHIIPLSKGGINTRDNYAILCEPCNKAKTNYIIDPEYYFKYMPSTKMEKAKNLFTQYLKQVDWLEEKNVFMTDAFDMATSGVILTKVSGGLRQSQIRTTAQIRRLSPEEVCLFGAKYIHKLSIPEKDIIARDPKTIDTPHYMLSHKGVDLCCFTTALQCMEGGDEDGHPVLQTIFMVDYELKPKKYITAATIGIMLMDITEHVRFTLRRGGISETMLHCYLMAPSSDAVAQEICEWLYNTNKSSMGLATCDLGNNAQLKGTSIYLYQGNKKDYMALLKRYGAKNMEDLKRLGRYEEARKELEQPLLERLYGGKKHHPDALAGTADS